MSRRVRIDSVLLAGGLVSIAAAAVVSRALGAPQPPPEPLAGLIAPNLTGVSASPDRVWRATLATFRAIGLPAPAGARWEYLPWDVPVTTDGETIDGVADVRRNVVRINPMVAVGDGRDLPAVFGHEVAHLVSYAIQARGKDDAADEAAAEALARDLVPVIRRRLRLDPLPDGTYSYQQQVNPYVRGTFRACRATMPRARARRVEQCARHTRRAFLLMDQANRAHALQVWGVQLPAIPAREAFHAWIAVNPARTRTIGQQLQHERRQWAAERRALRTEIRELHAAGRFRPTVAHAVSLAAAVTGASRPAMVGLFTCEATMNPKAASPGGLYVGLGQFDADTWGTTRLGRAGFDRTDPYAMAFATVELFDRRGRRPWPVCGRSLR